MNNSATEHDTLKSIISFYSESKARSENVNISCYEKIPKIDENPLIIYRLGVSSKFYHFGNVLKTLNNSHQ